MNDFRMLSRYFQSPDKPVTSSEFVAFWASCSESERYYYRWVNLKTGLLHVPNRRPTAPHHDKGGSS
jgi:hypothetical protein